MNARTRAQEDTKWRNPSRCHGDPDIAIRQSPRVRSGIANDAPGEGLQAVVNLLVGEPIRSLDVLLRAGETLALDESLAEEDLTVASSSYAGKLVPHPDVHPRP